MSDPLSDPTTLAGASPALRYWRRATLGLLGVVLLCLLSLTPHMTSSTELVRMRNALLLDPSLDASAEWTPETMPPSFMIDRGTPLPEFQRLVRELKLVDQPDDWSRAVLIARHLLDSKVPRVGGAIQSDLHDTYWRIVDRGQGYCGDLTDVFVAIATAAGIPSRRWAFSFDGFGGHGHIWPEIWNASTHSWQLVGITNNNKFMLADGQPISALDLRRALLAQDRALRMDRIVPELPPGYVIEAKAWDYYRRGLGEWYLWWGSNVYGYDADPLVRALSPLSRSAEQLAGIARGKMARMAILPTPQNEAKRAQLLRLQWQLRWVAWLAGLAALGAAITAYCWWRARRN